MRSSISLRKGWRLTPSRLGGPPSYSPPSPAPEEFGRGSTPIGSHFGVGEFTTHFRTYFSGWIGMFTGGTIWVLTHGHLSEVRSRRRARNYEVQVERGGANIQQIHTISTPWQPP